MNKKSLLFAILSYTVWGLLPLYWQLFNRLDPFFVLANRIVWSVVFCGIILAARGRLKELWTALRDRNLMKYMLPASFLIAVNWGTYIWAVTAGYVLDASLGYYLNPLLVLLCSVVFFRERCTRLELIAFGFALAGVLYSTVQYGAVPWAALTMATTFALYGSCKKAVHMEPVLGIALETLITMPIAIGYIIWLAVAGTPVYAQIPGELPLLVLAGVVTAVPLILYARGVNSLSFLTMGFLQYISPTLMLLSGLLFMGQSLDMTRLVTLILILIGLAVYSYEMVRKGREEK